MAILAQQNPSITQDWQKHDFLPNRFRGAPAIVSWRHMEPGMLSVAVLSWCWDQRLVMPSCHNVRTLLHSRCLCPFPSVNATVL
ncbi:hypothetical protein FKM82_002585 [Ascaphus truei]